MSKALTAEKRTAFKSSDIKSLRQSGRVPAVVYGKNSEGIPVHVDAKDLMRHVQLGGADIFSLDVSDGSPMQVMIKDIQRLNGRIIHADFVKIDKNTAVRATIAIDYQGEAKGSKEGGIFQVQATELEVEALPNDLPSSLEIDISNMEIGDKLTAGDIKLSDKVKLISSEEEILASVVLPQVTAEDTDDNTSGEPEVAPELVGDEGKSE
ncbi:50S ribosomal protein L25 [Saccharibacillus kuerlensis]|uniref:Large ribosomal subunit protein bL25 n=1 Tax=Saccharibacillus kuerlensis TaxID=459527 RepID=A0ABQ2KST1_9BACL|nr:50S ribosomal protein L25 [Saccharibacillus kuerlensis]GGN91632.1 50S ribosomal protein L25 [Saccharibacillus kuerlensis]